MADYEALRARVQELAEREWDTKAIEGWFKTVMTEDIPKKTILTDEIVAKKQEVLDRVQRKAEECEFLSHS